MDFIVDLAPSKGFTTVMVVVDRLTKMAHLVPITSIPTTEDTAEILIREIYTLHGVPDEKISDQGVQFTLRLWKTFCSTLGIEVAYLLPFIHNQKVRPKE